MEKERSRLYFIIRNAVNAGKEVTVHEKSINKHGWKGFGYIVIDPETGAGAYIIEGRGNGGWLALANNYLILYGPMAWEKIRQDRITYNPSQASLMPTIGKLSISYMHFSTLRLNKGGLLMQ